MNTNNVFYTEHKSFMREGVAVESVNDALVFAFVATMKHVSSFVVMPERHMQGAQATLRRLAPDGFEDIGLTAMWIRIPNEYWVLALQRLREA